MKIKSLSFVNSSIIGDLVLDFTGDGGNVIDNIIIAGENGTGKSTILNAIYEFSMVSLQNTASNEKRIFNIILSPVEVTFLFNRLKEMGLNMTSPSIKNNELIFTLDFSFTRDWRHIQVSYFDNDGSARSLEGSYFSDGQLKILLRSLFSDVEINFSPNNINYVTAKNIDEIIMNSVKSSSNLATEITQLLIDIQALDDSDLARWVKLNPGIAPPLELTNIRMKRFTDAFNNIFPSKNYKKIINEANNKKVIFEEHGKEMSIENLSSGEKQIVFRGGFLLKDINNTRNAAILIDEPEISLHPNWQLKIIDFYKQLFINQDGVQESQIFFTTHSPFIIHNNMLNSKVIILNKTPQGNINTNNESFFGWTAEKAIEKAFNISLSLHQSKPIIFTEGITDWMHMETALTHFKVSNLFTDLDIEFYKQNENMGYDNLLKMCRSYSKSRHENKLIFVFDRDISSIMNEVLGDSTNFKDWGNNVYSFPIPIPSNRTSDPDVCIELYYSDQEIKQLDSNSRRLYLSNEFSYVSGRHNDLNLVCRNSKINSRNTNNILTIIDTEVYDSSDNNVALPKRSFADYICNNLTNFNNMDFKEFSNIFTIIDSIIQS